MLPFELLQWTVRASAHLAPHVSSAQVARTRVQERGWKNVHVVESDACTFAPPEGSASLVTFSYSLSSKCGAGLLPLLTSAQGSMMNGHLQSSFSIITCVRGTSQSQSSESHPSSCKSTIVSLRRSVLPLLAHIPLDKPAVEFFSCSKACIGPSNSENRYFIMKELSIAMSVIVITDIAII